MYSDKGIMSTTISENVKEDIYDDELNYIIIDEDNKILYVKGITIINNNFEVMLLSNVQLKFFRNIGEHKKMQSKKTTRRQTKWKTKI